MSDERLKKLITFLESAAEERVIGEEAMAELSVLENTSDEEIRLACHELRHYLADADIREKDEQYALHQRRALRQRAMDLRKRTG